MGDMADMANACFCLHEMVDNYHNVDDEYSHEENSWRYEPHTEENVKIVCVTKRAILYEDILGDRYWVAKSVLFEFSKCVTGERINLIFPYWVVLSRRAII